MARPKRVLSGMRPTGRLHLGHYFGALSNWLEASGRIRMLLLRRRLARAHHALRGHLLRRRKHSAGRHGLAFVGLDPAKSTLVHPVASVLEHAELHVLLSMITPLSWLERVPTYKEQIENLKDRDLGTYGFLGYPLLQSADIVMYGAERIAGARRRRPGAARRAHPRSCPPLQYALRLFSEPRTVPARRTETGWLEFCATSREKCRLWSVTVQVRSVRRRERRLSRSCTALP